MGELSTLGEREKRKVWCEELRGLGAAYVGSSAHLNKESNLIVGGNTILEGSEGGTKKIGADWLGQGCSRTQMRPNPQGHQSASVFWQLALFVSLIVIPLTINVDSQCIGRMVKIIIFEF